MVHVFKFEISINLVQMSCHVTISNEKKKENNRIKEFCEEWLFIAEK